LNRDKTHDPKKIPKISRQKKIRALITTKTVGTDEMLFLPITTLMNERQIAPDHRKYTMIDPDQLVQAPKKRITRHQL